MTRYKLTIEYDGTGLAGWQRQKDAMTVQELLEDAIFNLTQEKTEIFASGRTDAGVHALAQIAHVDINKDIKTYSIMQGINFYLQGKSVVITNIEVVDDEFHARFDAKKRYYQYKIINRRSPLALRKNRAWNIHPELNIELMKEGAKYLIGEHDFTSFRAAACQAKHAMRSIDKIEINRHDDLILIDVEAISFLHHMVRNIVGTLKMVATEEWNPKKVQEALEAKDRKAAGPTAPACGLYFVKVDY